jgi:heme O synthase-like polyprenyltransferase
MKTTVLVTRTEVEVGRKLKATSLAVAKLSDYAQLVKLKLSALVIITTAFGYLLALRNHWTEVSLHWALTLVGAFLIVGAANAFNQVLERDLDALMARTMNRPFAFGKDGSCGSGFRCNIDGDFGFDCFDAHH